MLKKLLLNVAPSIAGIAITVSYLPQLWLTFSTRNVAGQSLSFWAILDIALLGLFLQQIGMLKYTHSKNFMGALVQGVNLVFALMMTVMVVLFGGSL